MKRRNFIYALCVIPFIRPEKEVVDITSVKWRTHTFGFTITPCEWKYNVEDEWENRSVKYGALRSGWAEERSDYTKEQFEEVKRKMRTSLDAPIMIPEYKQIIEKHNQVSSLMERVRKLYDSE